MYYEGEYDPCTNFYTTTVADNQVYQTVYESNGNIPCPPSIMSGDANIIMNASYVFFQWKTPTTTPFATTYSQTNTPMNGVWSLMVYLGEFGDTGVLGSWSMNVYGKDFPPLSLSLLFRFLKQVLLVGLDGCIGVTCTNGQTCIANGWGQGSYACVCPPGTSGTNCGVGVLGTNFVESTIATRFRLCNTRRLAAAWL